MNSRATAAAPPVFAWPARLATIARSRPRISSEALILGCSAYFALFDNAAFWNAAVRDPLRQLPWILSLSVLMVAANALLLSAMVWRWSAKPVIATLLLVSAIASHYTRAYGIHIDADMIGNVLHTDLKESRELLSWNLLPPLLSIVPAMLLLSRLRFDRRPARGAIPRRLVFAAGLTLVGIIAALGSSRDLTAMVRNHREMRYLVSPANVLVSLVKAARESHAATATPLIPVAEDARQVPRAMDTAGTKPRLLLLVVGETARARNWGLNGYERQTTPELAGIDGVVNFPHVTACGSSTEVSLPCMFSIQGREHYDKRAIRAHESLLHVLSRAGIQVLWRDNQSGCKGVCSGLPTESLGDAKDPAYCNGLRCLDGILLDDAPAWLGDGNGDRVVVLHMLGNHGPNYHDRFPPEFRRFTPVCETADLGQCSREQIVNAYDDALLYTDHVLAEAIGLLQRQTRYDAALVYVSDHGESLGESGLYLHGMPWPIAPEEQTRVPMVAWLSRGFARTSRIDAACLSLHAGRELSHDNLFHSVLGVFDVETVAYRPERDIFASCRPTMLAAARSTDDASRKR